MKNKQNNWNVNSQEDEDGFSLNPFDAFIYDSTNGNQDYNSIINNTNSASDSTELILLSSKEKKDVNEVRHYSNQLTKNNNE